MNKSNSNNRQTFEQYNEQEQNHHYQFFKYYELQNRIKHPDINVPGGGEQCIVDKNLWKCRFCNRTKDDGASFNKKAHLLPEQLGNKLIISHSECDDCNELFANYESHLGNFLGPLKTLLGVKGKSKKGTRIPKHKVPSTGTKITHKGDSILWKRKIKNSLIRLDTPTEISFGVKHHPYIPLLAWKALSRTSIHLTDLDEISQYSWFIESITTRDNDKELTVSKGLCMVISIFIPSASNIFSKPILELYKRKISNLFGIDNLALSEKIYVVKTSSHIFQVQVFSNNDYNELKNISKSATNRQSLPLYPLVINKEYFEQYDLPNRSAFYFDSKKEDKTVNWIQFSFNNMEPITTDKLKQNGFSEHEIKCLKSNEQDSPKTLRKFNKLVNNSRNTT
ncbi:MAG TPA: hypothetical protein VK112_09580 [Fodinibius sp.]|nr:hypothetical protein [Fodinibius sp.]